MKKNSNTAVPSRNVAIELLRIIACLFVISIHTLMNYLIQGTPPNIHISYGVVLAESFSRCCVPIFFMITGFFLFQNEKPFKSVIVKVVKKIFVPTVVMIILLQIFDSYMWGQESFINALLQFQINWREVFSNLIHWSVTSRSTFYLWYMFSLMLVYLYYPLLQCICRNQKNENFARKYCELFGILSCFIIPTVLRISPRLNNKFYIPYVFNFYPVIYILIGYEFSLYYNHKDLISDKRKKKRLQALMLLLFLLGTAATFFCASLEVKRYNPNTYAKDQWEMFNYDNFHVLIQAIGIFGLLLFSNFKMKKKIEGAVCYIGKRTFVIYLIHYPILVRLLVSGFAIKLRQIFINGGVGFLFYPIFIIISFALCLLIASIIHIVYQYIRKTVHFRMCKV